MNRYDWLDAALLAMPGADKDYKAEWGWFRYLLCGKMFAAICTADPAHPQHQGRMMIHLKCDPLLAESLRSEYADIIPGYYCDKRHWNSIYLDGQVPDDTLRFLCRMSYSLVREKLPKKVQRELPVIEPTPGADA